MHVSYGTQPIASLLFIYRVSRGADYFSREGNPSSAPRFSAVPPGLPLNRVNSLGNNSVVFVAST